MMRPRIYFKLRKIRKMMNFRDDFIGESTNKPVLAFTDDTELQIVCIVILLFRFV